MNGFLLVDKPQNWTSFDVVNYVRKIIANMEGKKPRSIKVGHTGTLDPAATGLLVLCVGTYTKRAQELTRLYKTYQAEVTLGQTSTTGDSEGEITVTSSKRPSANDVKNVLNKFKGETQQTPPAFSAIKINGKRAYKLARQGKKVIIQPRTITIDSIFLVKYSYPRITFIAKVSSGTYIRALAEDIGTKLGTGAYMSALRRTLVGNYDLKDAISVSDISEKTLATCLNR